MSSQSARYSILFVCSGNICRSPAAENVFRARAERAGILPAVSIDSAGTHGYHEGEPPDPRSVAVLRQAGYPAEGRARELRAAELRGDAAHHLIVCMDRTHERHVLSAGAARARVALLRSFDPASADHDLADPYYGGDEGFDEMLELIERAMEGLIARVKAELSAGKER
jgi:protein-tyrosine phosphatase